MPHSPRCLTGDHASQYRGNISSIFSSNSEASVDSRVYSTHIGIAVKGLNIITNYLRIV